MYIPDSDADLQMHKEIVEVLEKLLSHYEAQAELNKSIQELLSIYSIMLSFGST